jgi:hypothetical protein
MRTDNKIQAIDAWCAWRTLQTSPYMNAVILRINQSFPGLPWEKISRDFALHFELITLNVRT